MTLRLIRKDRADFFERRARVAECGEIPLRMNEEKVFCADDRIFRGFDSFLLRMICIFVR